MQKPIKNMALASTLTVALLPCAALAAPLPTPVSDMIRSAAENGNAATLTAVVNAAKSTNPNSLDEIDALLAEIKRDAAAAREARLAKQTFFEGWKGQGEAGASNTTGNTSETNAALGIHLGREGLVWDHAVDMAVDYGRTDGIATRSRYFVGYNTHYKLDKQLYITGLVSWENNRFAGFNRRFTESVGLGYTIIDNPTLLLAVEGGPALRQTRYVNGTSESDTAIRLALRNRWVISPVFTFTEDLSYYGASHNSTVISDTGLNAALTGALSARLSYHVQYESNPPVGLKSTDTLTRVTLVYAF